MPLGEARRFPSWYRPGPLDSPPAYWSRADVGPVPSVNWMELNGHKVAISEKLGCGAFGSVFAVCRADETSCTMRGEFAYAMKLQILEDRAAVVEHFLTELSQAGKASDLGIGVKLYEWEIVSMASLPPALQTEQTFPTAFKSNSLVGVMIFDRWMSDLHNVRQDWVLASKDLIAARLETLIEILHSHNSYHADLKPSNVLVRFSATGQLEDLTLTDFGFAFPKWSLRQEVPSWTPHRLAYYFNGLNINVGRLPKDFQPLVDIARRIYKRDLTADHKEISGWILRDPAALDRMILYQYRNWR